MNYSHFFKATRLITIEFLELKKWKIFYKFILEMNL